MPVVAESVSKDKAVQPQTRAIYSAFFGGVAQLSKILVGFIYLKLVALYLGVDGMGQLGNFMSLVTLLSLLAGGGIVNGVIKYVAEFKHQPRLLLRFLWAAKTYSLSLCTIIAVSGVVGSEAIALALFNSSRFQWLIIVLSLAQFTFAFTNLVTGTLNGLGETKAYAIIQIVGNLLLIPCAWWLISRWGLEGAGLGMIAVFALYALPAFKYYSRSSIGNKVKGLTYDSPMFRKLLVYTVMASVGAFSVPAVEIIIRQALIGEVGLEAAGIWQASIKLSSAYMGFFVMFLAVYFMPMVSAENNTHRILGLVVKFMGVLGALFAVGAVVFYSLRNYVIPLLLSPQFSVLGDYIQLQLFADALRVVTYVIGFVVVAKAALKIYVVSEVAQGLIFCGFSIFMIHSGMGLKGVLYANILMNLIYLVCSVIGFYYYVKRSRSRHVEC
jgi:O-antigen/teichoic acid export membrane protein